MSFAELELKKVYLSIRKTTRYPRLRMALWLNSPPRLGFRCTCLYNWSWDEGWVKAPLGGLAERGIDAFIIVNHDGEFEHFGLTMDLPWRIRSL